MCEIDQSKMRNWTEIFPILDLEMRAFSIRVVSSDGQKLTKKLQIKGVTNILDRALLHIGNSPGFTVNFSGMYFR